MISRDYLTSHTSLIEKYNEINLTFNSWCLYVLWSSCSPTELSLKPKFPDDLASNLLLHPPYRCHWQNINLYDLVSNKTPENVTCFAFYFYTWLHHLSVFYGTVEKLDSRFLPSESSGIPLLNLSSNFSKIMDEIQRIKLFGRNIGIWW